MAAEFSQQHKDEVQAQLSLGILLASERQYKPAKVGTGKGRCIKARHLRNPLQPGTNLPSRWRKLQSGIRTQPRTQIETRLA